MPEKAEGHRQCVAEAYIADQVATKRKAAGTSWLDQRIQRPRPAAEEDSSASAYKAVHGMRHSAPGSSLVDQQMAGINAQIVQARSELAESRRRMIASRR